MYRLRLYRRIRQLWNSWKYIAFHSCGPVNPGLALEPKCFRFSTQPPCDKQYNLAYFRDPYSVESPCLSGAVEDSCTSAALAQIDRRQRRCPAYARGTPRLSYRSAAIRGATAKRHRTVSLWDAYAQRQQRSTSKVCDRCG